MREVEDLARQASPMAINRLVDWAKSDGPAASVRACQAILDRAFGKPAQAVEHKGTVTHDISSLSDSDLAAILAEETGGSRGAAPKKNSGRLH